MGCCFRGLANVAMIEACDIADGLQLKGCHGGIVADQPTGGCAAGL